MSTPAGRFNLMSISMVLESGSKTSIRGLCVRISNCSCESLSMNVERRIVNLSFLVGKGTGPTTLAPLRSAVSTMRRADWSKTRWSYALSRMRIFWRAISPCLIQDFRDNAGADRQPAFTYGELRALLQRHRHDQLHAQVHRVARHHHLHPLPPNSTPTLSPACPSSSSLWNISTPVHTELVVFSRSPTISIGSPTFTIPRSMRPVTTVPPAASPPPPPPPSAPPPPPPPPPRRAPPPPPPPPFGRRTYPR